jgi:hypothetical protein
MQQKNPNNDCACYYLVYKVITMPTMWIVKVEDNKWPLFDHIDKFRSKTEKYYVIKKYVTDIDKELATKRFKIFNPSSDCYIIKETY